MLYWLCTGIPVETTVNFADNRGFVASVMQSTVYFERKKSISSIFATIVLKTIINLLLSIDRPDV